MKKYMNLKKQKKWKKLATIEAPPKHHGTE